MTIALIGANGSMGRRYQAILNSLERDTLCFDIEAEHQAPPPELTAADAFIIATPTETHLDWLNRLVPYQKPILCEKPLNKDIPALATLLQRVKDFGTPLTMMFQYEYLVRGKHFGATYYNYYNSGKDGLIWDCLQIIGLAEGEVRLEQSSPVWTCRINGQTLKSGKFMDEAYIQFVIQWLRYPRLQNLDRILAIHKKVDELARRFKSG